MQPDFMDQVLEVSKRVKIAYLATCGDDQPSVRPVQPAWDGIDLWIATDRRAPKVRQILKNPKVQLFYQVDKSFDHLTVTGEAEVVDDPAAKAHAWQAFDWNPRDYYSGVDDPNFGLLRVKVSRIELNRLTAEPSPGKLVWKRP